MNPDEELPNIDYFPVPRERIEVDPGGSSSMEVQSHKRPRALTPAERKRKSREAKSAAQKEEEKTKNKVRNQQNRVNQTEEKKKEENEKARKRMQKLREKRKKSSNSPSTPCPANNIMADRCTTSGATSASSLKMVASPPVQMEQCQPIKHKVDISKAIKFTLKPPIKRKITPLHKRVVDFSRFLTSNKSI